MRVRTLLLSAVLGAAGAVALPAAPASACIQIYVEPIGSVCNPCYRDLVNVGCVKDLLN